MGEPGMSEPGRTAVQEERRRQIVDAGACCVRRSGFHGASMAEIAQAAGLSVGQIYRYFENKEAIVSAIVARDVAEVREWFAEMQDDEGGMVDAILENCGAAIDEHYDRDRAALELEVAAEAARNPAVAAIVEAADAEKRALGHDLLRKLAPPACEAREVDARHEVLSMLFDGMSIRGVSNPGADREAIARVLRATVQRLLRLPLEDPAP
jgi:AcrR family transcriptional regulator